MSKRLQVLLPGKEMAEIQRFARRERLTVGEWVRRALRDARMENPTNDAEAKLTAIRRAAGFSFPTGEALPPCSAETAERRSVTPPLGCMTTHWRGDNWRECSCRAIVLSEGATLVDATGQVIARRAPKRDTALARYRVVALPAAKQALVWRVSEFGSAPDEVRPHSGSR